MEEKKLNLAQQLLARIGGVASLVAGVDGHWWSDSETSKKGHKRPLAARGGYGEAILTSFDIKGIQWSSKRFKQA